MTENFEGVKTVSSYSRFFPKVFFIWVFFFDPAKNVVLVAFVKSLVTARTWPHDFIIARARADRRYDTVLRVASGPLPLPMPFRPSARAEPAP